VHAATIGYTHRIQSGLSLQLSGGPSYVQANGQFKSYTSFNALASLQKVVKTNNTLSLYYTHSSGDSSGLGSVSDYDPGGIGFNHLIGRNTTVFLDLSAFDSRGTFGNVYRTRGLSAAASMGIPLARVLSLNWGGNYQRYDQTSLFGYRQKQV